MKRLPFYLAFLAVSLAAQNAGTPPAERLVILKYAEPEAISSLLGIFGAMVSPNSQMHALAVRADPNKWPAIEDAIRRLDVPASLPRNVEITVYFLVAGKDLAQGTPLNGDVEPVVTQLRRTFSYADYRVLDTLMLRTRIGREAEASGSLAAGRARIVAADGKGPAAKPGEASGSIARGAPIVTQVKLRAAAVDPDGKIHLDNVRAGMRLPVVSDNKGSFNYIDTGINTDIDVKDGQKVVVGKSSYEGPDKAVFLVLTAKLLD